MSPRNRKKRERKRGNGTEIKELRAIAQGMAIQDALRQEEKGGEPQKDIKAQPTPASVTQHFSPELAELETPYFVVNKVRYLGKCGLCDSPVTNQGRCVNPDCGQEWGDPRKLTDELVLEMIAKAKALLQR